MPWAVLRLKERALIMGDPEPPQAVQDDLGMRRRAPLLIGVLDPEDEDATSLPGIEPVEQRGAGATHMEVAGR